MLFHLLPAKQYEDKIFVQMTVTTKCISVSYILSCINNTEHEGFFVVFFFFNFLFLFLWKTLLFSEKSLFPCLQRFMWLWHQKASIIHFKTMFQGKLSNDSKTIGEHQTP